MSGNHRFYGPSLGPRHRKPCPNGLAAALITGALLFSVARAEAALIAEWTFSDAPEGTVITEIPDQAGGLRFNGSAPGIAATGDGILRIRRPAPRAAALFAPLPATSGVLWLEAELDGWHFDGRHGEYFAIGFADEIPDPEMVFTAAELNEVVLAEARLVRTGANVARVDGRAWGNGATNAGRGQRVPITQSDSARIALRYDPDSQIYSVFYKPPGEPWALVREGATDPRKKPNFARLNVYHPFNDTPAERVDVRRLAISTEPPAGITDAMLPALPYITAAAWAVGDAETGEILAAKELDTPRKIASINKVMAALLVAELATDDPAVLDELVVFDNRAMRTPGSTSALADGDRLSVRDALYGLMLPSGNDAAHMLAAHFSDRFDPPEEPMDGVPGWRANFVAEMNRRAKALGMHSTTYRSPAGYSAVETELTSTPGDLLVLARAAMQNPIFREIVGALHHKATASKANGTKRSIEWNNTNRLLADDRVDGIKTGTTRDAGPCLLTSANLDGRRVFAVVLDTSSTNRRYVDMRNLLGAVENGLGKNTQ